MPISEGSSTIPTGAFLSATPGRPHASAGRSTQSTFPVKLDPLSRWQIGDRLLNARLGGHPVESALAHERGLGTVPPGKLGEELLDDIATLVEGLVQCARDVGFETGLVPASIDILLPTGTRIVGAIPMSLGSGRPGAALRHLLEGEAQSAGACVAGPHGAERRPAGYATGVPWSCAGVTRARRCPPNTCSLHPRTIPRRRSSAWRWPWPSTAWGRTNHCLCSPGSRMRCVTSRRACRYLALVPGLARGPGRGRDRRGRACPRALRSGCHSGPAGPR